MAIILNIDTAVDTASICLSKDAETSAFALNENQKDHASWLHAAMERLLKEARVETGQLEAIAVTIGPGSYTGLRIGLAAAKGLCYALGIPLIAINTLEMIAHAVKKGNNEFVCPLIDARRMEVFTAVYNNSLEEITKPLAMIIDGDSFADLLLSHPVIFCGNGANKLQKVLCHDNAIFSNEAATAKDLARLSFHYYKEKKFANLAYTEPLYIKEFYSPPR